MKRLVSVRQGFSLPEYDHRLPRAKLPYVKNFFQDNILETPTVIREVFIIPPRLSLISLAKLLERTDEELELAAEMCGATVVPHRWGLVRGYHPFYQPRQLPKCRTLVAEVDRTEIADNVPQEELTMIAE